MLINQLQVHMYNVHVCIMHKKVFVALSSIPLTGVCPTCCRRECMYITLYTLYKSLTGSTKYQLSPCVYKHLLFDDGQHVLSASECTVITVYLL